MKVIAIGSNIDPERHVPSGMRRLHGVAPLLGVSQFYSTPPIGRPEQGHYWNGCVAVDWKRSPQELRAKCRDIERAEGRLRGPDKWAARELDLDVILFDDVIDHSFPLPDPDIDTRPFLQQALLDLGHPLGAPHQLPVAWDGIAWEAP